MAQKRKNKRKKLILSALLVVLFVATGVGAYLMGRVFIKDKTEISKQETPAEENTKKEEVKSSTTEVADEAKLDEPEKKVKQYEGEDPNQASGLTGSINYAVREGNALRIRTSIDQYLTGGACEIILKANGNNIYNSSASIVPNASNSTCEGFDIPVPINGISSGKISIIINLSSGGKSGVLNGEVSL